MAELTKVDNRQAMGKNKKRTVTIMEHTII